MKYSIRHERELNNDEEELLRFLFSKRKTEWLDIINRIKVIARCGCGRCPTILLGTSFDDEIKTNQPLLIDYLGYGINGQKIGVSVFGNEAGPTELEFWSPDGYKDVERIPTLETLEPM